MRLRSIAIAGGAVLAGLVALSVLTSLIGITDLGEPSDPDDDHPATTSAPRATSVETTPSAEPAPSVDERLGPPVAVRLGGDGEFAPPAAVVGGLRDGMVVPVTASGFPPDSDGSARQCVVATACGPSIPVRFDGGGRARFLFLLADEIDGGGRCRDGGAPCTLDVTGTGGSRAVAVTAFGAAPRAAPSFTVTPRTGLDHGSVAQVDLTGFPPRATVSVVQCVAPDISGPRRCGFPGPALDVTTDARGAARVGFPIHTGRVGTEPGLRCERRTTCGISVLVDGIALAPVVGFELAAVPGAEYDAGRLALGLALAGAFALAALVLGLTTRWRLLPDPFA